MKKPIQRASAHQVVDEQQSRCGVVRIGAVVGCVWREEYVKRRRRLHQLRAASAAQQPEARQAGAVHAVVRRAQRRNARARRRRQRGHAASSDGACGGHATRQRSRHARRVQPAVDVQVQHAPCARDQAACLVSSSASAARRLLLPHRRGRAPALPP
jgi:hypothetical protein